MKTPIVVIGMGELGGVFARAFLKNGHPVFPVTRSMNITEDLAKLPEAALVLVTVAEKDLHHVLPDIPAAFHDRIGLLQNELLPKDWETHRIQSPTVISVWFEKKRGRDVHILLPSPVFGPHAALIAESLAMLDIPCRRLASGEELTRALVIKNTFVYTINIAGLSVGETTGELWSRHNAWARAIANEVLDVQEWLTGRKFPRDDIIQGMAEGIQGDPSHICAGRAAPERLERLVRIAVDAGIDLPEIRKVRERLRDQK